MQKTLFLYVDKHGNRISKDEFEKLNEQVMEDFPVGEDKNNSLLQSLQLITASQFVGKKFLQPALKQFGNTIGKKFNFQKLAGVDPNDLGKIKDSMPFMKNTFLEIKQNEVDETFLNVLQKKTKLNDTAKQKIVEYGSQYVGNMLAYNTIQNLTGQENEKWFGFRSLTQSQAMTTLNGRFASKIVGNIGLNKINRVFSETQNKISFGTRQQQKSMLESFEQNSPLKNFFPSIKKGTFKDLMVNTKDNFITNFRRNYQNYTYGYNSLDIQNQKKIEQVSSFLKNSDQSKEIKDEYVNQLRQDLNQFVDKDNLSIMDLQKGMKKGQISQDLNKIIAGQQGNKQLADLLNLKVVSNYKMSGEKQIRTGSNQFQKVESFYSFTRHFEIPYLGFNPAGIFQPRMLREYYMRPIGQHLSDIESMGYKGRNLSMRELFVSEVLDDTTKKQIKEKIFQDIKYQVESNNPKDKPFVSSLITRLNKYKNNTSSRQINEFTGDLIDKLNQDKDNLRQAFKDYKNFDDLAAFDNVISNKNLNKNQIQDLVLSDILFKSTSKNGDQPQNLNVYNVNGKLMFEQKFGGKFDDILKNNKLMKKIPSKENTLLSNFKYTSELKTGDYFYSMDKQALGHTMQKVIAQEQMSIKSPDDKFLNKVGEKYGKEIRYIVDNDLPFNQYYSLSPTKFEEVKEFFNYINIFQKKGTQKSIEQFKETGKISELSKTIELYNNTLEFVQNKGVFGNDVIGNDFTKEVVEQFDFFEDIRKNLDEQYKFAEDKDEIRFWKKFLPSKLERQEQEKIVRQVTEGGEVIDDTYLNRQITVIGQTRRDIIDKMIITKKLQSGELNIQKQQSLDEQEFKGFKTYIKNIKELQEASKESTLNVEEKGKLINKRIQKIIPSEASEYENLEKVVRSRFKRPDLYNRMFERQRENKFFKARLSKNNYIIMKSSTKSKNKKGIFLPREGTSTFMSSFLHYIVDRPIQLAEELGLGRINPNKTADVWDNPVTKLYEKLIGSGTHNQLQSLTNTTLKRIVPIAAAGSQIGAVNQLATIRDDDGQIIWSPKQQAQEQLSNLTAGLLKIGEVTKVTEQLKYTSQQTSNLFQNLGINAQRLLFGPEEIFMVGQISEFLTNLPDAERYQLQVTGGLDIGVKKARWWEFGRTPYLGGKSNYYRPHLLHLATTGWEFSDTLYGSPMEYLAYQNQLSPLKYLNSNYFAEKHSYDRPYQYQDNNQLQNLPMVGNVLQGQTNIFNPATEHSYLNFGENEININGRSYTLAARNEQPMPGKYQSMFRSQLNKEQVLTQSDTVPENLNKSLEYFKRGLEQFQDYLGFAGFMSTITLDNGNNNFYKLDQEWARPEMMTGNRLYYQKELGGLLGMTEYFRRFKNNFYGTYGSFYYNPIPNELFQDNFDFLPNNYFIDFFTGDPYQKMPYGEVRLPGHGRQLQYGKENYNDKLTQFEIIQNVAPYSRSFSLRENKFEDTMYQHTMGERYRLETSMQQAQDVRDKMDTNDNVMRTNVEKSNLTITDFNEYTGMFEAQEENVKVKIAGQDLSVDQLAKEIFETQNVDGIYQQYQKARQVQQDILNVLQKSDTFYSQKDENKKYIIDDEGNVNAEYINKEAVSVMRDYDIAMNNQDQTWQDKQARYRQFNPLNLIQQGQEYISQASGLMNEKFGTGFTPKQMYERYMQYGTESASWSDPIKDFLFPMFLTTSAEDPLQQTQHGANIGFLSGGDFVSRIQNTIAGAGIGLASSIGQTLQGGQIMMPETRQRYQHEEKFLYQSRQNSGRNIFDHQRYQDTTKEFLSYIPIRERKFIKELVNTDQESIEDIKKIQPEYTNIAIESIQNYKKERAQGRYQKIQDVEQLNKYYVELQDKYDGNLEEYYTNDMVDLEMLKQREIFSEFDSLEKFGAYTETMQKQLNSILKEPMKNSYYSTLRNQGVDIIGINNTYNQYVNPYLNVNSNRQSYNVYSK